MHERYDKKTHVSASHRMFKFIHRGDDVGAGESRIIERHVEFCHFKCPTVASILCREISVMQSMQWTQYLFAPRRWVRLTTESQVERVKIGKVKGYIVG